MRIELPDIKTDDDLLDVLNELKHRLKAGIPYSQLQASFSEHLNLFLSEHGLDCDRHAFATRPVERNDVDRTGHVQHVIVRDGHVVMPVSGGLEIRVRILDGETPMDAFFRIIHNMWPHREEGYRAFFKNATIPIEESGPMIFVALNEERETGE